MCAAVQIKEFYPFEQKYEYGVLSYRVMSGKDSYYIDRDVMRSEGPNTSSSPVENFVLKCDCGNIPNIDIFVPAVFRRLKTSLSAIYSNEQEFEKVLTAIFVLGTYTYQAFDNLPSLWFYLPRPYQRPIVEKLLRNICFNGIVVTSNYTHAVATACIDKLNPTLIFQQYCKSKSNRLEALYSTPNTRDHFLPTKELGVIPLYCPKIVLSSFLPLPHHQTYTMPIIVNKPFQILGRQENFASLRAELVVMALCIQDELSKARYSSQLQQDIFSPLETLATTLNVLGALTQNEADSFSKAINEKKRVVDRIGQISHDNDILIGISEYLKQESVQRGDGFEALSKMVEFLNEIEKDGMKMNARLLSRFLNRFQLVEGRPIRKRSPATTPSGYTQCTTVKIDTNRLHQLISSDLIYQDDKNGQTSS